MPKGKSALDDGLKYLVQRGDRWLVRVAVPRDLRGHPAFLSERGEPKAHVETYLRTDSRAKAKVLKRAAIDEIKASFERARAGGPVTEREVKAIAEANLRRAFDKLAAGIIDNLDRLPELQEHVKVLLDNPELGDLLGPWSGHALLETAPSEAAADDLKRRGIKPTAAAVERQTKANLKAYAAAIAMIQRGMAPPPMPAQPAPRQGALGRLDAHVEDWLSTLRSEPKTKAMACRTIAKLAEELPRVENVTSEKVQAHVNRLAREGVAVATIRRLIGNGRGYWVYLASLGLAPKGVYPFDDLVLPRASKKGRDDGRKGFAAADMVRLLHAAEDRHDRQLADLIKLAMWTGARREELCSLKVGDVKLTEGYFAIRDAKSTAGVREVPIHSQLEPTLRRLTKGRPDDNYVLIGLPTTKYGDRGDAIGKRFSRLKRSEPFKFGGQHTFHSIRRTVTTLLRNAGALNHVIDEMLGWDHDASMREHYTDEAWLELKRETISKLKYPDL